MNLPNNGIGNPFVGKLLSLQQDGSGAISSPSNWSNPPLLRVTTPVISQVRAYAQSLPACPGPRWLVLIGGPGNGKSMAVQELVHVLQENGFIIQDELGCPLESMGSGTVPAVLEVRSPNGVLAARIAQDASVVPNPYVLNPNPASDLRNLLALCLKEKCHLVVCANRGVLESAAAGLDATAAPNLREVLDHLVSTGRSTEKVTTCQVSESGPELTAIAMDSGTLFAGEPSVFVQLLDEAAHEVRWSDCQNCECATLCPFKLNRDEIAAPGFKQKLAHLVEDAELLDGQPLVFREAAALVSLLLAGCPADYEEQTPCQWVRQAIHSAAWFRLAARRNHMLLFSATDPLGLRRAEDIQAAAALCEEAGVSHERLIRGLPSTRVGIPRLLGSMGVMRRLDPLAAPLGKDLEAWDDGYIATDGRPTELEKKCQSEWDGLDLALQEPQPSAIDGMAALARWKSNHALRFAALHEGSYAWAIELARFREAIGIPKQPSPFEKKRLEKLLREVLDSKDGIRVAPHVKVVNNEEIKISWAESAKRRSICVSLGDSPEVLAQIPASAFVWLSRRHDAPLHDGTFPAAWLQSARDAIAQAAAARQYSRKESGALYIKDMNSRTVALIWEGSDVQAQEVPGG